jgi:hypothetical protein
LEPPKATSENGCGRSPRHSAVHGARGSLEAVLAQPRSLVASHRGIEQELSADIAFAVSELRGDLDSAAGFIGRVLGALAGHDGLAFIADAHRDGFIGDSIADAVASIAQGAAKRMDLSALQQNSEKQQRATEQQQRLLTRQIAELRAQTEAAGPEAARREKGLMTAIEATKTEPQRANDEVEKQRKVQEELLRFIGPVSRIWTF